MGCFHCVSFRLENLTDQTSGYVFRKSIPETGEIWLAGKLASAGTSYTVTFGRQLFQHLMICKNTTANKKPGILHSPKTGVCAAEIGYALTSSDFTVSLINGQRLLLQRDHLREMATGLLNHKRRNEAAALRRNSDLIHAGLCDGMLPQVYITNIIWCGKICCVHNTSQCTEYFNAE